MALGDSLGRLGASALRVAHQRLELAALDVEEELLRTWRMLASVVMAALLATLALGAAAAFVVVAFWDTARLAALAGVTLVFAAAAVAVARNAALALASKPRFLSATLAELAKDRDALSRPAA